jgi:hypothetical protein
MTMREKIARAICAWSDDDWAYAHETWRTRHLTIADRVLDAMREPTDNMIEVGFDISLDGKEWGKQTDICGIWRAMIDAAKEQR